MATTNGYITKLALPTYEFTVGEGVAVDYLLHGDGTNPTLDSSANGYEATNGGGVVPGGKSKFGDAGSWYSTAADVGYRIEADQALVPASGEWTVEGWFYDEDNTSETYIWGQSSGQTNAVYCRLGADYIRFDLAGTGNIYAGGFTLTNTWNHIAIVRESNTIKMYVNGQVQASTLSVTSIDTTGNFLLGTRTSSTGGHKGYIDEFRISDTARYTSNFTPSTTPFSTDSNTLSLLHFDGDFTDVGTEAASWTAYNASVSTTQVKMGKSLYFPGGSTGYLQLNGQTDFALGTGDFTIAFWVNHDNTAQPQHIVEGRGSAPTPVIYVNASTYRFYDGSGDRIFGGTFTANTWTHIALVRKSGITKMYQNGTQIGSSYTDNNNYIMSASRPYIGCYQPGSVPLRGYLEEFLWIKGYALYDGNFTAPTEPYAATIGAGTTYSTSTYGVIKLG